MRLEPGRMVQERDLQMLKYDLLMMDITGTYIRKVNRIGHSFNSSEQVRSHARLFEFRMLISARVRYGYRIHRWIRNNNRKRQG